MPLDHQLEICPVCRRPEATSCMRASAGGESPELKKHMDNQRTVKSGMKSEPKKSLGEEVQET